MIRKYVCVSIIIHYCSYMCMYYVYVNNMMLASFPGCSLCGRRLIKSVHACVGMLDLADQQHLQTLTPIIIIINSITNFARIMPGLHFSATTYRVRSES